MTQACSNCDFWKKESRQCRRYPPQAAGIVMMTQATIANPQGTPQPVPMFSLPETSADFLCGEYSGSPLSPTLTVSS